MRAALTVPLKLGANSPVRLLHEKAEINPGVRALSNLHLFTGWNHPVHLTHRLADSPRRLFTQLSSCLTARGRITTLLGSSSRSKLCQLHCTPTWSQNILRAPSASCVEVTSVPGCLLCRWMVPAAVLSMYLYAIKILHISLHQLANIRCVAPLILLA